MSLPRVLFAGVVLASLLAAALVVRERTPDLALEVTGRTKQFSPNRDGHEDVARIRFFVREDDARATVQIVDSDEVVVRTFSRNEPLQSDVRRTLFWHGLNDSGSPAPEGRYRLRVILPESDRDMIFPRAINLVRGG